MREILIYVTASQQQMISHHFLQKEIGLQSFDNIIMQMIMTFQRVSRMALMVIKFPR